MAESNFANLFPASRNYKSAYEMAADFRLAFRLPFAQTLVEQLEIGLQVLELIKEEAEEAFEAAILLADCLEDVHYQPKSSASLLDRKANMLKELCDLKYVVDQYAAAMGWDIDEAYRRVHESNMSKLDDNGDPIYHPETGKVLKSSNYIVADLSDLVG